MISRNMGGRVRRWLGAMLLALATPALAQAPGETVPFKRAELWNTEQFVLSSAILKRDMLIQVARPLLPPTGKVPAVYLLDGDIFFGTAITAMMGAYTKDYAPAYFIGIGNADRRVLTWYGQRVTDLIHRADVTLTPDPMRPNAKPGGGALFQRFLKEELRPEIERRYSVDPARSTLAGVSLGGLFATHVMLDDPGAFSAYLIGSPSLWAERALIDRARTARLVPGTKVFVSAGGLESGQKTDARALAAALRANPSKLAVSEWIVPGETHDTFGPSFLIRAFRTILPVHAR